MDRLTPDVARLRALQQALSFHASSEPVYVDTMLAFLDALLASPPDGAAERAGQAHRGDPCRYCGTPHDEVAPGPCPARTPAPGEAQAAGDAAKAAYHEWRMKNRVSLATHPRDWDVFEAGWNAALAARPAAVTEAMVEAAARVWHGDGSWESFPPSTIAAYRQSCRKALSAALAAGAAP